MSSGEGDVALGTTREYIYGLLIGYLDSNTGVTEKVEARELNGIYIDLEADRTFHFISKPLVSVLLQCVCLAPNCFLLHHNTSRRSTHYFRGSLLILIGRFLQQYI